MPLRCGWEFLNRYSLRRGVSSLVARCCLLVGIGLARSLQNRGSLLVRSGGCLIPLQVIAFYSLQRRDMCQFQVGVVYLFQAGCFTVSNVGVHSLLIRAVYQLPRGFVCWWFFLLVQQCSWRFSGQAFQLA